MMSVGFDSAGTLANAEGAGCGDKNDKYECSEFCGSQRFGPYRYSGFGEEILIQSCTKAIGKRDRNQSNQRDSEDSTTYVSNWKKCP
jgi:hypothetical protein